MKRPIYLTDATASRRARCDLGVLHIWPLLAEKIEKLFGCESRSIRD